MLRSAGGTGRPRSIISFLMSADVSGRATADKLVRRDFDAILTDGCFNCELAVLNNSARTARAAFRRSQPDRPVLQWRTVERYLPPYFGNAG